MSFFRIFRFFQEASTYTEPDQAALQDAGIDVDRHADYHRSIVRVSGVFGAIGFALGVVGLILFLTSANPGQMQIGMVLMPLVFAIPGLLFGVALSCLFAPRGFLLGPIGNRWMELIGTRNVTVARLVCCLVALVFGGAALGMGVVILFFP
jgi:hypothetical protein